MQHNLPPGTYTYAQDDQFILVCKNNTDNGIAFPIEIYDIDTGLRIFDVGVCTRHIAYNQTDALAVLRKAMRFPCTSAHIYDRLITLDYDSICIIIDTCFRWDTFIGIIIDYDYYKSSSKVGACDLCNGKYGCACINLAYDDLIHDNRNHGHIYKHMLECYRHIVVFKHPICDVPIPTSAYSDIDILFFGHVAIYNNKQMSLTQNETEEINAMSVAYGYPFIRFLLMNEIRDRIAELPAEANHLVGYLSEDAMTTKLPLRDFPTEFGPMTLIQTTRSDSQLISEPISAPFGTEYPRDHEYYLRQNKLNATSVQELFAYLMQYTTNIFSLIDPGVYESTCRVFDCDRIIAVPERTVLRTFGEINSPDYFVVERYSMSLGFIKKDIEPKFSKYCLSAHLRE